MLFDFERELLDPAFDTRRSSARGRGRSITAGRGRSGHVVKEGRGVCGVCVGEGSRDGTGGGGS